MSKDASPTEALACELCILGAGIAGLNALFAASRHLSAQAQVVVVDRNKGPAGMWNHTYRYVRLHQAHPMFTAGNIPWRNQPDAHHLATRTEVLDHLQHCYETLQQRVKLDARFGYTYQQHEEAATGEYPVTLTCRRQCDGAVLTIRARKLIKAFGYNVERNPPLPFSSQAVRSISPEDHDLGGDRLRARGPFYIVGGGKTAMDTAHLLVRDRPGTTVRMLVGAGTMFINRDRVHPRGALRRHVYGSTMLDMLIDLARRFDGRNEQAVLAHLRRTYCVSLDEQCQRFAFGLLSPQENREISQGVDEVIRDHLVDVVDSAAGPEMVLRSGARRQVEPDAVFINATGYIGVREIPYEPFLSRHQHVLSIQPSSIVHFLSSQSAFFLTPLFMEQRLADVPLYEIDGSALRRKSRDLIGPTVATLTLYNTSVLIKHLPRSVLADNGLDPMRLYPRHRRLMAVARLLAFLRQRPHHMRDALDTVRQRIGVHLGRLSHPA